MPTVLSREEAVRRILELPVWAQPAALEAALEVYGPAEPEAAARWPLMTFVEHAWKIVEPGRPFVNNWHIGALAEHLTAVSDGQIRRLIINIPFRHMKSLMVSVFWQTWEWTWWPETRWLMSAYAEKLTKRDNLKARRVITHPWYKANWGHVFRLTSDQNEKLRFENNKAGYRIATSVGGAGTGEGGDRIVVDDPLKAGDAHSEAIREGTNEWWAEEMSSRGNDVSENPDAIPSAFVIIAQRLHDNDLPGYLLREEGDWTHLMLPWEYEPERKCCIEVTGFCDPRTEPGELLWPERFPRPVTERFKRTLGSYGASGQMQQRPSPGEGGIFQRLWWRFWKPQHSQLPAVSLTLPDGSHHVAETIELPLNVVPTLQSWDMTFKGKADSDFVVGQAWGSQRARLFLFGQVRQRATFTETLEMVRAFTRAHPTAQTKLVEDKANGPAVIDSLMSEIGGFIPIEPDGDKVARAWAASPTVEAGDVYLPHPALAPWVWDLIEEAAAFPNSTYKDQVDTLTQAIRRKLLAPDYDAGSWATVKR